MCTSGPFSLPKKCIFIVDPVVNLRESRPIAWSLSDAGTERTMSYSWEETWAVLLITTVQSWMESSVPTAMKGPVIRLFLLIDCLLYFNMGLFFIDLTSSFRITPRQIYCRDSPWADVVLDFDDAGRFFFPTFSLATIVLYLWWFLFCWCLKIL